MTREFVLDPPKVLIPNLVRLTVPILLFRLARVEGVSLNPHPELVPSVQTSTMHTYDDRPANNVSQILQVDRT